MRMRFFSLSILTIALLAAPSAASAAFPHTVLPGESLSSIAATDGLSVAELAAANGLSTTSELLSGGTVLIPPQSAADVAPATTGSSAEPSYATTDTASASTAEPLSTSSSGGSYLVQPGDTLTAIAARAGMSVAQLAVDNGLDPNGILYAGNVLRFSGSGSTGSTSEEVSYSPSSSASSGENEPVGNVAEGDPNDPPYPTPERVSADEIGSIANANGVPPSLAEAIGWQESGFNNDLVSSADARGVMQILPGTWDWINTSLTGGVPLAPASAASNVRGGVLLLHSLLGSTGDSSAMAAAGYYQGLSSVQKYGMYSDTQQYVNSVLALEQRFGGG
jgi:LysM repeat protein